MLSKIRKLFGSPSGNAAPAAPHPTWKQLGNAALAEGNLAQAAMHYREGAAQEPTSPQPHLNLAYCLLELGDPARAEQALLLADRYAPVRSMEAFEASHLLARAREEQGDMAGSAEHLRDAVRRAPDQFEGWTALARAQALLGDSDESMASLRRAIALKPDALPEMALLCGLLLMKRLPLELLEMANRVLALDPENAKGHIHAGQALHMLKRSEEALRHIQAAEVLGKEDPNYWCQLAVVLKSQRRFKESAAAYESALKMQPDLISALVGASQLSRLAGDKAAAATAAARALSLKPVNLDDFSHLASLMLDLGQHDECIALSAQGLQQWPDNAEMGLAKSFAELLLGRLPEAWEGYEQRFRLPSQAGIAQPPGQRWHGQPLHGKALLLSIEQGLGDSIQMLRFLPVLCQQCDAVYMECHPAIAPLVEALQTKTVLLREGMALPRYDYYCPLMSLPYALQLTEATIPVDMPYIHVPEASRLAWSSKLGPRRQPRLGMVWSGNPNHVNDANRSLPLKALLDAIPLGWDVFSLQKELRGDDAQVIQASDRVRHFGEDLHGFMDTAALASEMDLVISVDTSVAHLVGALGRPLWLLLPHNPDWRWIVGRNTTPWYPTAKLFRQTIDQLPTDLLERIGHELTAELARVSTAPG